jgi:pimeloyl-ACP methyl ester carboxylesterase
MTDIDPPSRLSRPDGNTIAYRRRAGAGPAVVFLGGFKSDMTGTKATALDAWAAATGRAFLRFDYMGHGASSGVFTEGTIGRWIDDALAAIDALTEGSLVLVGSSMGGWIATHVALARRERVRGLVTVAAAPDFTERLVWGGLDEAARAALLRDGVRHEPSAYDEDPYPLTWKLVEEGRRHLLLDGPVAIDAPARLHHGLADADVPWSLSVELAERLTSTDVVLTLVKGGDHRLSSPADLARLVADVEALAARGG